jgi:hypothetical protein
VTASGAVVAGLREPKELLPVNHFDGKNALETHNLLRLWRTFDITQGTFDMGLGTFDMVLGTFDITQGTFDMILGTFDKV